MDKPGINPQTFKIKLDEDFTSPHRNIFNMKLKLLFLLKKNLSSAGYVKDTKCSGLYNSALLLADELSEDYGHDTRVVTVQDGNSVDRELSLFKPHICVLEAIWVTPKKLEELTRLHKKVVFIVRIHSEIPFLSNEGVAIDWIRQYVHIPRVIVAFNSKDAYKSFKNIQWSKRVTYLPNIYDDIIIPKVNRLKYLKQSISYLFTERRIGKFNQFAINIGCFGAIRPVKNQLIQAIAALEFAKRYGVKLRFHINGTRLEQGGESVLKNIQALFKNSGHDLVEHPWLEREDFLKLINTMDLGMQVSFNESFNIVAADFVSQGVPVVVSNAIKWMPKELKVSPVHSEQIVRKIEDCFIYSYLFKFMQYHKLNEYNKAALKEWERFLKA